MTSPRLVRAAGALVALTAFLLVFGSTVRVHGAGLACPDWPLCFGEVVPAYEFKTYLEFGHRVVAGVVSLGFVGLWVALARAGVIARMPVLKVLFPLAALVLAVQVVLGGLTVLELLAEWTVASHLVTGNTFAALLLVIALAVRESAHPLTRRPVTWLQRGLAFGLALLVPTQVVLGGLVAGANAGLACATWPGCNGAVWFPTFEGLVGLQVLHRITAYSLAAWVLVGAAVQWRSGAARRPALLLVALVGLQIGVGIANVLLRLPMEVTLLHSAGAMAIFLSTAWLQWELWRAPVEASAPTTMSGVAVEAK